jgi:thermostable 8-oxoguanine DNA glycosylase
MTIKVNKYDSAIHKELGYCVVTDNEIKVYSYEAQRVLSVSINKLYFLRTAPPTLWMRLKWFFRKTKPRDHVPG